MSVSHPDPERLALAALPAEPADPALAEHLVGCAPCREHVAALRRTVDLARTGHADRAAPPERVWQAITDELGSDGADADRPPRDPIPGPARPAAPARRWRAAALPVAAAVAGIAAGVGIGLALSPPDAGPAPAPPAPPGVLLAQLAPVGPADQSAHGTVDGAAHDGVQELVVRVEGVTDTRGGDYLEAWLLDPAGTRLVSLGALTRTDAGGSFAGEFTVPANLPMTTFTTVDISAERWDGDPSHSRVSLLRGTMS
jgi:hypothetical protein